MRLLSSLKYAGLLTAILLLAACSDVATDALAPPDSAGLTYTTDIKPIFDRSCIRCHGEEVQNGASALNLSSYERIQNFIGDEPSAGIIIIPGLETSRLLTMLNPQDDRMYKYLDEPGEYNLIYNWVVLNNAAE